MATDKTEGAANYGTQFPQSRLLDGSGNLSQEWFRFFWNMFNRTGTNAGTDGTYISNTVNVHTTQIASISIGLNNAVATSNTASMLAISVEGIASDAKAIAQDAQNTANGLAIVQAMTMYKNI